MRQVCSGEHFVNEELSGRIGWIFRGQKSGVYAQAERGVIVLTCFWMSFN